MAETSYPWQTGAGTAVTEALWQSMASRWQPSGVLGASTRDASDTSLQPTIPGGGGGPTFGMTAGSAFVNGVKYDNSAALTKTVANNGSGNPRIDRLVLKLDQGAKTVTADILVGTPGTSPQPPSLTGTATISYLTIARATVPGGGNAYTNLVDERVFVGQRAIIGTKTASGAVMNSGDTWFQPDTDHLFIHNGSAVVPAAEVVVGNSVQQRASGFIAVPGTVYTEHDGNPAIPFAAPATGKVWVHFAARMVSSAADVLSLVAFEIRTGGTTGGGSVFYPASDDDAVGSGNTADGSGSRTLLVTGLTPGDVYHARLMYRRDGGADGTTAGFSARTIGVQPAS